MASSVNVLAGTGSGIGKITKLWVNAEGTAAYITFSQPIVQGECGGAGMYIAELDETQGSNRFYSTLLSAAISKKNVAFWIDGCTESEYWGSTRSVIRDINIHDL